MHQLTQQLKSGKMEVLEVPFPTIGKGQILVRNHYSVISAGTEGKTVSDARKGYIAKAKSRRKEVTQVIEMAKSQGLLSTYKMVMNKLEAESALGYSCAGEVIAVGEDIKDIKIGDMVACGGQGAYHAEVVAVYRNLCVKLPENVDAKYGAFATIASIAIQGIRQADLRMGENCVVIGLGLIGQFTMQLLDASGVKAIGIDIDQKHVETAKENGAKFAYNRNQTGLENIILNITDGYGTDAVIITAATSSLDPVELAGNLCRKKGKVIIVGSVPTGFSRKNYYQKELDLRMSCSYGAGRYDPNYEQKGNDYPIGYVRWTENRNMQAYVDLLEAGKLNIDKLITHTFALADAPKAYNMILEKSEHFTGILIKYDAERQLKTKIVLHKNQHKPGEANVGFIGAGNFAQNMLLPRLKGLCNMIGVAASVGNQSRYVADKYSFNYCTDNADEIIKDKNINTIFIVTPHNLHAHFIKEGLKHSKNVYVEKPLAMTLEELNQIKEIYENAENPKLMLGFNRRFSPPIQKIKQTLLPEQPKAINIRINTGKMPKEHWINDPEIGGGRIIGEACHFIDLAMYISGGKITGVVANAMEQSDNLQDTLIINLTFDNGSIASISYLSNGSKKLPKEYIEVFCDGQVFIIYDFKKMEIYGKGVSKQKFPSQDKGHKEELIRFIKSITEGLPSPISFDELYLSTLATFKVIESIKTKKQIYL